MPLPQPPAVPQTITVHLGRPDDTTAENVTVPFNEYIKNVASSEIYPTWPESALRANILAQISFALNRVFTEHYRAQGYPFDITNSTAYDQAYVQGRNIFGNISQIVDEIFNDYLRREGYLEPLFAQFCNGTTVTCPGMSQWGTVTLAEQGYTPFEILQHYYGDDIELVRDAPIQDFQETYPGVPLRIGSYGADVQAVQLQLNTISRNYPAIPKIASPDGIFGVETEEAVRKFQEIFNLTPDGIVGKATWYRIIQIRNGVLRLAELNSEGLKIENLQRQYRDKLSPGDSGDPVLIIQYYLRVIGEFNDLIPVIQVDGIYGPATEQAVIALQNFYGLPPTGEVDETTWHTIEEAYRDTLAAWPPELASEADVVFPGVILRPGVSGPSVSTLQTFLSYISDTYPDIPKVTVNGYFGPETQNAVLAYQNKFGLPARGIVGPITWSNIARRYRTLMESNQRSAQQNPGRTLNEES